MSYLIFFFLTVEQRCKSLGFWTLSHYSTAVVLPLFVSWPSLHSTDVCQTVNPERLWPFSISPCMQPWAESLFKKYAAALPGSAQRQTKQVFQLQMGGAGRSCAAAVICLPPRLGSVSLDNYCTVWQPHTISYSHCYKVWRRPKTAQPLFSIKFMAAAVRACAAILSEQ